MRVEKLVPIDFWNHIFGPRMALLCPKYMFFAGIGKIIAHPLRGASPPAPPPRLRRGPGPWAVQFHDVTQPMIL